MPQLDLPIEIRRRQPPGDVADEVVKHQPHLLAAINLCIQVSGREDKEIGAKFSIDQGHLTRIRKGEAHFPPNILLELMEFCGNEIPLRWLAMKSGYELKRRLSEIEAELARQLALNAELQSEIAVVRKWFASK